MHSPILPPPARPKIKKKRPRSMLLGLLGFGFAAGVMLFVIAAAGAGFLLWQASKDLPSYERLAEYEPPVMTRIHAHDGSMIKEYARERRIFVPINTIPKLVTEAFISAEDKRFYDHGGLDFIGIARASLKYAERMMTGRGSIQGASTITQQVAKNMLLNSDRTFDRKLREAILATRIERAFSKDKILELYLNEIFLGVNAYGIAAAGLTYFSKELKDLTIEEAAYLAALPKAPSFYHPYRRTKEATARRNWIIDEMAGNGFITRPQADAAKLKPLTPNMRSFGAHVFASDFFAEDVRRTILAQYGEEKLYAGGLSVRTTLDPQLQRYAHRALHQGLVAFDRSRGWRGALQKIDVSGDWGQRLSQIDVATDIAPWRLGVVIEVTRQNVLVGLRPHSPQAGQQLTKEREAVRVAFEEMRWAGRFIATDKEKGRGPGQPSDLLNVGDVIWVSPKDAEKPDGPWSLMQVPEVGGGLLAMDPHTGRILAVSGGFSFEISQFDRALQAKRQPGSSYKPLVYAAAIDNGYKPTSIVLDEPVDIESKPGQKWEVSNYGGGQGAGPSTLRTGIEKSRNLMTARLGQDLGMPIIQEYSKRFGAYDDLPPLPAMVLGAGETTVVRMVTAYAAFANGGKQVRATLVDRIQDRWGRTVWRHDQRRCENCNAQSWQNQQEPEIADDRRQIIDPHTAFQMTAIMEGVVTRGTATVIKSFVPNTPLAGKTGSTNESKDVWFVGYSPDLVVGVYVGYDNPKPMGSATGGQVAAPIFGNFMKLALADKKAVPFRQPAGIKQVWVNKTTGLRANRGDGDAIAEYFKPGEEPDDSSSFLGFEQAAGGGDRGGAPVRDPYSVGSGSGPAQRPPPRPARAPQNCLFGIC